MRLFRRVRYILRQRREARALAEELDLHRAMTEEAQREAGASEAESRMAARRLMGNTTLAAEDARRVWLWGWLESVFQDLRYGARSLMAQPGYTAMALFALVFGIGLNTSLFTAVNAIMFRPWNVPEPHRVVELLSLGPRFGYIGFPMTTASYFNQNSQTIEGAFTGRPTPMTLDESAGGGITEVDFVSAGYFRVLHVGMILGRDFDPSEDVATAPVAVAVLSHSLWKEKFASNPAILGRSIRLDGVPFTIIGVAPESFRGTTEDGAGVWTPLTSLLLAQPNDPDNLARLTSPEHCCSGISARLRPGITREQAQAELTALYRHYSAQAEQGGINVVLTGTAMLDHPGRKRQATVVLVLLLGAVGSILLLACANVSNLLLARSAARQREIAVRVAIGAGRWRVIRQLLTESLLLSAIAAAGGVLVSTVLPELTLRLAGKTMPVNLRPTVDQNVLLYAIGVAVVSAVAFGLAPALQVTRIGVNDAMKRQSGNASPRVPLRGSLLAVQVAISVALLIAAGLLVRGVGRARSVDPGFQVDGITAVQVTLPPNMYDAAREGAFYEDLLAKLGGGGQPVAASLLIPFGNRRDFTDFGARCASQFPVMTQRVSRGYFETLRIPVLMGREFGPEDRTRGSIVVNESLARACWAGQSPLGQMVTIGGLAREVVGVVRDAQVYGIGTVQPTYFAPFVPDGRLVHGSVAVLVPSSIAPTAVATVRQMDARAATEAILLTEQMERSLGDTAGVARIAGGLGLLALLLATVGVYGVISYSVEQRRREIGVRMALGAQPGQVIRLVLKRNALAVVIGLGVGLALAAGLSMVLKSELYGLSPADPLAYVGVLGLLFLAGLIASVIPARRAARTDALTALHHE